MSDELRTWLPAEIKQRGWSQREFARRADISHPLVSQVFAGEVPPSADFCIKAAHALEVPPEKVLRLAGILPTPPAAEDDPTIAEILDIVKNLTLPQRKLALRLLHSLYQNENEEE
jgi:transcriptional regulator with XRE-family HTH domain